MVGDQRVGMTVPKAMGRLEQRDEFHVLEVARSFQHPKPVRNRLAVLLLDGWEVRGWPLDFL